MLEEIVPSGELDEDGFLIGAEEDTSHEFTGFMFGVVGGHGIFRFGIERCRDFTSENLDCKAKSGILFEAGNYWASGVNSRGGAHEEVAWVLVVLCSNSWNGRV